MPHPLSLLLLVGSLAHAGDPLGGGGNEVLLDDLAAAAQDTDRDGLHNGTDNCLSLFNPDQADGDGDGVGDTCDLCPSEGAYEKYGCPGGTADPKAVAELVRWVVCVRLPAYAHRI